MQLYTTLHSDAITSKGAWLLRRGDGTRGPGERRNLDLSYVVTIKFTVETSQNFVAFSEYMNFTYLFFISKFKKLVLFEMEAYVLCWQKLGTHHKINVFWFQNDLRINCQNDGQFCGLVWVKVVFFCAFAASQFSMGFLADHYGNWRVMKHTVKYLIVFGILTTLSSK